MEYTAFMLIAACFGFTHGCSNTASNIAVNGICYWIIPTQQNQTESQSACKISGGYLAVIPDSNTLTSITDITKSPVNYWSEEIFLGYHIDDATDTLTTLSGSPTLFDHFYDRPASLASSWKCVSLFVGYFYQEKCGKMHYALCSNITNEEIVPTDSSTSSTSPTTINIKVEQTTPDPEKCNCDSACSPKPSRQTPLLPNMTEAINLRLAELTKAIKVEKSTLTLSVRKKISMSDPRPSAKGIGCLGVVILLTIIIGIILLDFPVLMHEIKAAANRMKTRLCRKSNNRRTDGCCFKSK